MSNILDTIIAAKHKEVALLKEKGINFFEQQADFKRSGYSLKERINADMGIHLITEFKRKSPSKGNINLTADIESITQTYANNGCSAISILTDQQFFGGANADIEKVRPQLQVPILRKEFIIDEIQLLEAKALGADLILLIAACLTPTQVKTLAQTAKNLGLEVLLELHADDERRHICTDVDFVGINNRNLKDFSVSLQHSIDLRNAIGNDFIAVAESGIKGKQDVDLLYNHGFNAFLIGEYLMQQTDIGATMAELKRLNND